MHHSNHRSPSDCFYNVETLKNKNNKEACHLSTTDTLRKIKLKHQTLDGRLPDIDYTRMQMRNLDDLNTDRILMEVEVNTSSSVPASLSTLIDTRSHISRRIHSDPTDETPISRPLGKILSNPDSIHCHGINQTDCYANAKTSSAFPHVVYTTADRLARTMELQQQLFQHKLMVLSQMSGHDVNRNNGVDCHPPCGSMNPIQKTTKSVENGDQVNVGRQQSEGKWIVRKQADGTRYITRRPVAISPTKPSIIINQSDNNGAWYSDHNSTSSTRHLGTNQIRSKSAHTATPSEAIKPHKSEQEYFRLQGYLSSNQLSFSGQPLDNWTLRTHVERFHRQPIRFKRNRLPPDTRPQPTRGDALSEKVRQRTTTYSGSSEEPLLSVATL